jgi:hypothetical protein
MRGPVEMPPFLDGSARRFWMRFHRAYNCDSVGCKSSDFAGARLEPLLLPPRFLILRGKTTQRSIKQHVIFLPLSTTIQSNIAAV